MIGLGANINLPDSEGYTPLVYGIRKNKLQRVISMVTVFNADTKSTDKNGSTIIHHVVRPRNFGSYENIEMLNFLIKKADFNAQDNSHKTPLDYARQQQSGRLAEVLEVHKAKETSSGVKRVNTSIINEVDFPKSKNEFQADYEKFLEECKKKSVMDKVEFQRGVPIDDNVSSKEKYNIVLDGEDAFDCYMIKVDISHGLYSGNTFYKMQILREKIRDVFVVFTRWGRVGSAGQFQHTPFATLEDARKEFCSIFKSKSGNQWEDRHNFQKVHGKYRLVPFVTPTKHENFIKAFNYKDPKLPRSSLNQPIYDLMRRICNQNVMAKAFRQEYSNDLENFSLQNMSRQRLQDATVILDNISEVSKEYEKARSGRQLDKLEVLAQQISELSSEYYELIPNSNYKDQAMPPIIGQWAIDQAVRTLNDLIYCEIQTKMIGAATLNIKSINPMDYCYNTIGAKIMRLERNSDEFQVLEQYVNISSNDLQPQRKSNLICNIYAIERSGEREATKIWEKNGNKILLWHGTKPQNVLGIIQTGFRIAPIGVDSTGAMFGPGIYFADNFAKSYNYTPGISLSFYGPNESRNFKEPKKYMMLCEVLLGNMKKLYQAEQITDIPNSKFQSVMAVGSNGPSKGGEVYLPNGSVVPLGKLVENELPQKEKEKQQYFSLNHNEYIVYNTSQVRIKYILELR